MVAHLSGKVDLKDQPDGRISAAVVYEKLGLLPFLSVIIMDVSLAAGAVFIAKAMSDDSIPFMVFAGIAAVAGHNWSVFLRFKGGLGATPILGALVVLLPWPVLYGLIMAGIFVIATRKSSLSTVVGILVITGIAFVQKGPGLLATYPLILFSLMMLKKYQVSRLARPV
jgi:glycerol-3-phosphate acyltransferase PlsY